MSLSLYVYKETNISWQKYFYNFIKVILQKEGYDSNKYNGYLRRFPITLDWDCDNINLYACVKPYKLKTGITDFLPQYLDKEFSNFFDYFEEIKTVSTNDRQDIIFIKIDILDNEYKDTYIEPKYLEEFQDKTGIESLKSLWYEPHLEMFSLCDIYYIEEVRRKIEEPLYILKKDIKEQIDKMYLKYINKLNEYFKSFIHSDSKDYTDLFNNALSTIYPTITSKDKSSKEYIRLEYLIFNYSTGFIPVLTYFEDTVDYIFRYHNSILFNFLESININYPSKDKIDYKYSYNLQSHTTTSDIFVNDLSIFSINAFFIMDIIKSKKVNIERFMIKVLQRGD